MPNSDLALLTESATAGRSSRKLVVGLLAVVVLGVFGYESFKQSMATFIVDYNELKAKPGQLLQVPGVVDKATPQRYNDQAGTFEFGLLDVQTHTQRLQVKTHKVKPSNFDQASQVTCIGTYKDGYFDAREILVKCPSKEQDKVKGGGSPT